MGVNLTIKKEETRFTTNFKNFFLYKDVLKEFKDQFYAVDIFTPERLVKKYRLVAALLTVATIALLIITQNIFSRAIHPLAYLAGLILAPFTVLMYPYYIKMIVKTHIGLKKSEKNSEINKNFYVALSMFVGFAKGKIPLSEAIKHLANSNLKGIREEFAKINLALTIHGLDLRTALLKVALTTPNEKLSYFLRGLANYVEETKDYSGYIDNFLQLDNINRKIELSTYSDKMKNVGSIFIVLITALSTLAIISVASVEEGYMDIALYSVYLGLPLASFLTILLSYVGNPLKEGKKEKGTEAIVLAVSCAAFGLLAASFTFMKLSSFKPHILAISLILSLFGYIYTFGARRKENKITSELDSFLSKLRVASELKSNILEAVDRDTVIGKELSFAIARSSIESAGKALLEASARIKHSFLSSALYVLSVVIHKTKKISDVLLALIYEYHRYVEVLKLRKSVFGLTLVFILISAILTTICMGIMKYQFIPMFEKVAKMGKVTFDPVFATNLANDSVIIIAATAPLAMGAISGDFRKCFSLQIFLLSIALLFLIY